MKCKIILLILTLTAVSRLTASDFDPFSESKSEYDRRAQWLHDAKVGVFIHWNPSSVIAKEISWCRKKYGAEQYDQLYKRFTAEHFDADAWIKLFYGAGIRYAVIVPKHHDGFCMFETATSEYNVMHTPFGRDYVKEMAAACVRGGVKFCLYYSILDWWNTKYTGKKNGDLTEYKEQVFKPHMRELLTNYPQAGYIWFDGSWEASWTHTDGREMYAFIRNLQHDVLVGNRIEPRGPGGDVDTYYPAPDAVGDFQAREIRLGKFGDEKAWDKCYKLCQEGWSWGDPMTPRPLHIILSELIQTVGRDGSYLIGVGPRPDGTIDQPSSQRLLEIGGWLTMHGEAIYGTRGGPYLPGNWGVSTRKGNSIYLFITNWWSGGVTLPALSAKVRSSRVLSGGSVRLAISGSDMQITIPENFRQPVATVVEIALDGDAMALPLIAVQPEKRLSHGKPVVTSSVWKGREKLMGPSCITDDNDDTFWVAEKNAKEAVVTVDLQQEYSVGSIQLSDAPYKRTRKFDVEALIGEQWIRQVSGTDIGESLDLSFLPVRARQWRLIIRKSNGTPTLATFAIFAALTPIP